MQESTTAQPLSPVIARSASDEAIQKYIPMKRMEVSVRASNILDCRAPAGARNDKI